jgi:hypothetical protein
MKKILMLFCFCLVLLPLSAQDASDQQNDPTKVEIIQEKDGNRYTLTIEYIPVTNEARFIYTCMSGLFHQDEAMAVIKKRATTFRNERGYTTYTYIRKDDTRYDNATKTAIYTTFLLFKQ